MWPFWLLFLLPACLALKQQYALAQLPTRWNVLWWLAFLGLVLIIGLRYEVGGDWQTYIRHLDKGIDETFLESLLQSDPAYKLLNWFSAAIGGGVWLVNTISALLFSWGLIVFSRQQPRAWLAITVAIPYLVTVVAMGYTRQAIAIGLSLMALSALRDRRLYRYFIFMCIAALFHKTAIIMLPLAAFSSASNRWMRYALTLLIAFTLYILLIRDAADYFVQGYLESEYNSQGATIRVAMNALPALLFVCYKQRFRLSKDDETFWFVMAVGALLFVPALIYSPSSTAVDRLALYWIPIQLFVFARLPDALGLHGKKNSIWVMIIVAYSAIILAVWLIFATHAQYWLPYQFYPWVWAWDLPSRY